MHYECLLLCESKSLLSKCKLAHIGNGISSAHHQLIYIYCHTLDICDIRSTLDICGVRSRCDLQIMLMDLNIIK